MENISKEELFRQSEAAVRRMKEMNSRSTIPNEKHKMPPAPSFVRVNGYNNEFQKTENSHIEKNEEKHLINNVKTGKNTGLGIPFLDMFKKDSDMAVIIGLMLLLLSENGDKTLLLALLYILM